MGAKGFYMTKFGKIGQRVLKTIHLLFVSLWVGGAVSLYAMTLFLGPAQSGFELYGYAMSVKFIDDMIIVPGAMGSLSSGLAICLLTHWGFLKHGWVVVKIVLTVLCVVVGIVVLGATVDGQPPIIEEFGLFALEDETYKTNRFFCLLGGGAQLLAIVFMCAISTIKPWGKKKAQAATE
jgi:ABC-type spermidine/putrescine transport system permease subunit II